MKTMCPPGHHNGYVANYAPLSCFCEILSTACRGLLMTYDRLCNIYIHRQMLQGNNFI